MESAPKSCPHFPRCGGCRYLNKSYDAQLREKSDRLRKLFSGAAQQSIPDIVPSPVVYRYRHKVQLPFGAKKAGRRPRIVLGCFGRDSHDVVDQHECLIQDRELSAVAWAVRDWAAETGLPAYDEGRGNGFLRHVLLRKGAGTGEILLCLVTCGGRPEGSRRLAETLLAAAGSAPIVGIVQNVNMRQTNVVLGEKEFTWWGRPFLFEKLGPFRFSVGVQTFFQVNPFQTPALYDEVLRWIEGGPAVIDLYCGVGSISLWVAKKSRFVTGVEENGAAMAAAKKAAFANRVRNVRFVRGGAGTLLPELMHEGYDTVIVDPPRKGLETAVTGALLSGTVRRMIYVSCDPESLSRDLQSLAAAWRPVSIRGFDMFPHTEHIETVAVLDRK